ncbi:CBS domain-containing protein [Planktothrix agardhii]|uniref:Polynucleotide adenylyltransferase n=1 Tax=Planktothrix agardhii No758 TaxID=1964479 RepID=A0A1U9WXJ4_PLAAG|nr:CBS domain-containing protein [Planktothrix agardhii]AQY61014.1 polynucleotide adenylyltransferase [Planktothrix agardhii No758]CAD5972815.1 CCA-adding enzyme [Planktothrix agardhii]
MHLILCHKTVDFDALGAAVGLTRIYPGSRIVLAGGSHPAVRDFLALYRDEFALIEQRSVNPNKIHSISVVDTQSCDRLGKSAEWFKLANLSAIRIYDHHPDTISDIPATETYIESVGATTTLIVEMLRNQPQKTLLTTAEATVMALGIHLDTGSLTFPHSTARDAIALAWLMEQGANLPVIAEYVEPGLPQKLQELLSLALEQLQKSTIRGYTVAWILFKTDEYVPGLSTLASELIDLTESDALLLANQYGRGEGDRLSIIGRSRIEKTNLNELFKPYGGGGHTRAASVALKEGNFSEILEQLVEQLKAQIPHPPTAQELMSSPVRTIRPNTSVEEAHRILLRYDHSGLSVVDEQDQLVGIISRRDLDIALHHGFSHAPVKGYMTPQLKTITPETTLPEIEALMVTYDIGRLPVLQDKNLVGIVTRTDVLRLLHQQQRPQKSIFKGCIPGLTCTSVEELLEEKLATPLLTLLNRLSFLAEKRGWQIYLVGGAVRDLLLAKSETTVLLNDIDIVVDGCYKNANFSPDISSSVSPAVELAQDLQKHYPAARLDVHGQFQTAALLWHNDPILDSLWIDIATARTEFYPYPAANPQVEASSIRQDLYRRDFTINALALRLTSPQVGELLDFFGGLADLESGKIRVLHANSFIEDPTRIYRAVRFTVRLGFEIEAQTQEYISYAISSGIYEKQREESNKSFDQNRRIPALETRLKSELRYIFQSPDWKRSLKLLGELKALRCIHPSLELSPQLWRQVRSVDRCLQRFDPENNLNHWEVRLEVLVAYLSPEYREKVAQNLQLQAGTIERLKSLELAKNQMLENIYKLEKNSQFFWLFKPYNLSMLILMAVQSPRQVRKRIWQYLTQWRDIKPPLNGNDLKAMGYKPSDQFKQILDDLLTLTLDGEIGDRAAAEAFLQRNYPLQ